MKKFFLDTNIFLRYFLNKDSHQYKTSFSLISKIEGGEMKPYTSTIVLLELHYVGSKTYNIPENEVMNWLQAIFEMRNMTIIEKTDFKKAIVFCKKYRIKLADCLIASQIPKNTVLVTFDEELRKIKEVTVKSPSEITGT